MSEPSLNEVRDEYMFATQEVDMDGYVIVSSQEAYAQFDAALAAHDREVKAEALREYADLVEEIANLGAHNTGLRTPHHLAEYTRNYADRIESQETP